MKDLKPAGWMPVRKLERIEAPEPEKVDPHKEFERKCWDHLLEPIYEECSTCGGHGFIDETLGGIATSNPRAVCPDCEGVGGFRLHPPTADRCDRNAAGQVAHVLDRMAIAIDPGTEPASSVGYRYWWKDGEMHWEYLSPEQVYEPAPAQKDGWIEHPRGNRCPVQCGELIEVRVTGGKEFEAVRCLPEGVGWTDGTIIAYRLVKPCPK